MKVAIRADAYPSLGTGHVMRCIALGQGIKGRGGEVVFITHCDSEGLVARLRKEGFNLRLLEEAGSLSESLRLIEAEKPDWVVLDGYHFDTAYQKAVKDAGHRLMVIDDYAHLNYYHADIVLNQNYGAEQFHYNTGPDTKLLLGTKYALLRREFLDYKGLNRQIPEVAEKLLITMGGADPDNHTLKVLKAVNQVEIPLVVKVIVGAANAHYESLKMETEVSRHEIEIMRGVEDMAPLMAWADAAVSAGGSTVWELAFMGLPSLLCVVADNQEDIVRCLDRDGVFDSCGRASAISIKEMAKILRQLLNDHDKRAVMTAKCRKMVDGRGAERVVDLFASRPLSVLFLGGGLSRDLASWLVAKGEKIFYTEEKVDARSVYDLKPDLIISYNYRYILRQDVLDIPLRGAINLHISYLPWNRGAHPNVWSFIEDSPKGVTIHYIDEGVDTGDILLQEEVFLDDDTETLETSYEKLHKAIQDLFKRNWEHLRDGRLQAIPQPAGGSLHFMKDSRIFEPLIAEKAWDTPVRELKEKYGNARISGN